VSRARYFYICKQIPSDREAEMNRAEKEELARESNCGIVLSHVRQFVPTNWGTNLSATEVAPALNQNGYAQNVCIHMMQVAEGSSSQTCKPKGQYPGTCLSSAQAAMVQ
jgi:hypothetical protein